MEKIKQYQNIIIIVLIVLGGFYYIINSSPQESDYLLQEKCAKTSESFYNDLISKYKPDDIDKRLSSYRSHYNKSMGTCILNYVIAHSYIMSYGVYDAVERRVIMDMNQYLGTNPTTECTFYGDKSEEELIVDECTFESYHEKKRVYLSE